MHECVSRQRRNQRMASETEKGVVDWYNTRKGETQQRFSRSPQRHICSAIREQRARGRRVRPLPSTATGRSSTGLAAGTPGQPTKHQPHATNRMGSADACTARSAAQRSARAPTIATDRSARPTDSARSLSSISSTARLRLDRANEFVTRNAGQLSNLAPEFGDHPPEVVATVLARAMPANTFDRRMEALERRARKYQLESSDLVMKVLSRPRTHRPSFSGHPTAGTTQQAHSACFFRDDRARSHADALRRCVARGIGGDIGGPDAPPAPDFRRRRGNLPPYGGFSNYKHICVQQGVNLASTGH